MPRTQIYTCTACGQYFNGREGQHPPGWAWRAGKLLCDDCTGHGPCTPAKPAPLPHTPNGPQRTAALAA